MKLIISACSKKVYLSNLKNRVYKILPMFEELDDINVLNAYIEWVIIEMNSSNDLFDWILIDIMVLINTLLLTENIQHKQVKKIVLDCANMIDRLIGGIENE